MLHLLGVCTEAIRVSRQIISPWQSTCITQCWSTDTSGISQGINNGQQQQKQRWNWCLTPAVNYCTLCNRNRLLHVRFNILWVTIFIDVSYKIPKIKMPFSRGSCISDSPLHCINRNTCWKLVYFNKKGYCQKSTVLVYCYVCTATCLNSSSDTCSNIDEHSIINTTRTIPQVTLRSNTITTRHMTHAA